MTYITDTYYSKNANIEQWKDIPNYKGRYQISTSGNIRSLDRYVESHSNTKRFAKGKMLKPYKAKNKYEHVIIEYTNHTVHSLMAITFIPKIKNKTCVNHIDGNKHNNNINNLEWCTYSENTRHAVKLGLHKSGKNHTQSKSVLQFTLDGKLISKFGSVNEAGRLTKFNIAGIVNCCNNKLYKSNNYLWKYEDSKELIWINDTTISPIIQNPHGLSKIVLQYSKDGSILLNEYNSVANAAKVLKLHTGNIANVCNNKANQTGGFKFKYKKDV